MSRNGSGVYTLPPGINPVAQDTTITSNWANTTLADIAAALTQSLARDGQTTPVANLPMGGYRHTNVGNPTARNHYASLGWVQDGYHVRLTSVGGTNDVSGQLIGNPTELKTGQLIQVTPTANNTGNVTLNVNTIGAKPVVKPNGSQFAAGQWQSGYPYLVMYDGTKFVAVNTGLDSVSSITVGNGLTGGTITDSGTISMGGTHSVSPSSTNEVTSSGHGHSLSSTWGETEVDADTPPGSYPQSVFSLTRVGGSVQNWPGASSGITANFISYGSRYAQFYFDITDNRVWLRTGGSSWSSFDQVWHSGMVPDTATRWPTWNEVTGKPNTATRWPTWNEVTGKPSIPTTSDFVATSGNQSNLSGDKSWTGIHRWSGSGGEMFIQMHSAGQARFGAEGANIHLRPNGVGNSSGQAVIRTDGTVSTGGDLEVSGAISASGSISDSSGNLRSAINNKVGNTGGVSAIHRRTQAQYDAISSKDPNTLYIIVG